MRADRNLSKSTDYEFNPYQCYLETINSNTPTTNETCLLKNELEDQAMRFYTKKKPEFMRIVSFEDYDTLEDYTTHEDFEAKNTAAFKTIFKFAHTQAKKLNKKSKTNENENLHRVSFNYRKENNRLNKILDTRHLGFSKEEDLSDVDEEEVDEMKIKSNNLELEKFRKESEKFQHNIYEHFAKKYNTKIDKYNSRTNLIKDMYQKAMMNENKMKSHYAIEGKILNRRTANLSSQQLDLSPMDLVSYSQSTILTNSDRESTRNIQKDVYKRDTHSFRITTDPVTLDVQIFKAPVKQQANAYKKSPVERSKSVMSGYSHSNSTTSANYSIGKTETGRLSTIRRTSTSLSHNKKPPISPVPMTMEDLNKSTKIIRAKCVSSLWHKY